MNFQIFGKIPDFEKKLSTMRSRGVNTSIIFQSIAQLKNRYPNDVYQEILGNCDTKICLGCSEMLSSEYVSKLLGTSTVETSSVRKERGFDGNFTYGMDNIGTTKRNLLNPDELIQLDNTKEIVILRGKKPLLCDKFDYSEHRLAKRLKILSDDYEPEWKKE